VRALDGAHDRRDARGLGERRHEPVVVAAADAPAAPLAARRAEALRRRLDVGGQARDGGRALAGAAVDRRAQLRQAGAGPGRHGVHRQGRQAVGAQQPLQVGSARVHGAIGERVGLVEHDLHHAGMAGHGLQVAVVPGGVGVLLGVDDPDQQVRQLEHPLDLDAMRAVDRVEVRQVEEHQALRRAAVAVMAARDLEPVQQRIGDLAPDRGRRGRGHRPPPPGRHELVAGERVEER
jgi:hypothetical protein